jgi:hypothetical protein
MKSPQATILGKDVYVNDSHIETTADELACDIRAYEANSLLRVIADLGNQMYKSNSEFIHYNNILVNDSFLIFSALFILNCGPAIEGIDAGKADLQLLFRKLWYIYDHGTTQEEQAPEEILLRIAYRQFPYQGALLNSFARVIYLYKNVWPNREEMLDSDIFQETLGLTFDQLFLHVFLHLSSDRSYFCRLKPDVLEKINETYAVSISSTSEDAFLRWASRDRTYLSTYAGSLDNALEKFPIINIGVVSHGPSEDIFLILTKNCLNLKVSQYLYYDFIDKYSDGKGVNIFKQAYGRVFQDYVGQLLAAHFRSWAVIPEVRYKKGGNTVDSVDWIVWRHNNLILIEVKQSSIFLQTKKTGSIDSYKQDCRTTLSKAFTQLQTTKTDIEAGIFNELMFAKDVKSIEMVCVVADPLYFGNMLLPRLGEEHPAMHVINISDLEDMLDIQKSDQKLHYLLRKKRKDNKLRAMDFKEYNLKYLNSRARRSSQFLRDVFDDYFSSLKKSDRA